MKNTMKKITALVIAFALCMCGIVYQPTKAEAATVVLDTTDVAYAYQAVTKTFTVSGGSNVALAIYVPAKTSVAYSLVSSATGYKYSDSISELDTDWLQSTNGAYYFVVDGYTSQTTTYTLTLTFGTDTSYSALALTEAAAYLSSTSITITKGFSQTIKVNSYSGSVTWSSSNTKVATVKNGKITGKKAGSATITAKLSDGQTLTCKVAVKNNVFTASKASVSSITYGKTAMQIYNASYSKGNLVLKARYLNNTPRKVVQIKNLKITVKNGNGKVIGTYTAKSLKPNLNAGKVKSYSFTIKKSKLKVKSTQDLRAMTYKVSGKSYSKY